MSQRDLGSFDFTAAFLLGALFGAGIALFLAPKAGDDLRKDLRKDVRKRSKRFKKDAGKQFEKAADSMRETGGAWREDAEVRIADLRTEIASAVEDGVRSIRETAAEELKGIEKRIHNRKRGLFR
ncbi:MAG: YtxH domain-containing protein [Gemmatimonadota bacterium]